MFGYIRACKPEMRVKEFEMYKAIYCSLCKELGKSYGPFARLTLSYDFTFLALLKLSLKDGFCGTQRRACTCNPLKKCSYLTDRTSLEMPAAAAMIMLYYKLLDNIADEKGIKRLGCRLIKPLFSGAHKKAAGAYPEIEGIISDYIAKQSALENGGCTSLDRAADPTAAALSALFALCSPDASEKRALSRMGYCIGRYIYILDAACDLEDDVKSGSYNPLKERAEEEGLKEQIASQLYICAAEAAKALELIEIRKFKNILDNIIYLGLEDTFKKELGI